MGQRGENDNDGDYEGKIRKALENGDGPDAVAWACRALRAAVRAEVTRRPAVTLLICAHLAGMLLGFARHLPEYAPWRPRGCPKVPRPEDALAAFSHSFSPPEEEVA